MRQSQAAGGMTFDCEQTQSRKKPQEDLVKAAKASQAALEL